MKAINVKLGHSVNYILEPTKRKGFYKIKTGKWIATVSKNTQNIENYGDENDNIIETRVDQIRNAAFNDKY